MNNTNQTLPSAGSSPAIHLEQVSKVYHRGTEEVHAVENVSLTIEPGSFLCLLGSSGSGKSTLLHIIGCLDQPSSGTLFLDEMEIPRQEKKRIEIRRKYFGFTFQQFFLIPTLTVEENILLPLVFMKKQKDDNALNNILNLVHLEHRKKHRPSQLSGGEMQRVAIARSLINNPTILIADEPTGNLDSKNSMDMFELFKDLNQKTKMTIICATHNKELAKTGSRILTIKDGKMQ